MHCHKIIDVDALYSIGLTVALAVIAGVSFSYSYGVVGLCATVFLVLYSSAYKEIITRYLPLKSYRGSN
jgi:hypothetical protein